MQLTVPHEEPKPAVAEVPAGGRLRHRRHCPRLWHLLVLLMVVLVAGGAAFVPAGSDGRRAERLTGDATPLPRVGSEQLTVDGRPYRLLRATARPTMIVVALHALRHLPSDLERMAQLGPLAAEHGWWVAYPFGRDGSWNAGRCCGRSAEVGLDDLGYLRRVVAQVRASSPVAVTTPVVVLGFSSGGMMALRLACSGGVDGLAAVVSVAGNLQVDECRSVVPFLVLRGGADATVPLAGGTVAGIGDDLHSDAHLLDVLRTQAGCRVERVDVTPPDAAVAFRATNLRCDGARGRYLVFPDLDHTYPTEAAGDPVDTAELVLEFLAGVGLGQQQIR